MILSRTLLLSCCLAVSASVWAEDKKLTLDQLPAAVKAAALKQANGVAISEIEEETKKGKTIYEVKFGDTEVTFDANGTVLSSKVEKEDDEDEDDEDDEDDDQKSKDGKKSKDGNKGKGEKEGSKDKDGDDDEDEDENEDDKKADREKADRERTDPDKPKNNF